MAKTNTQKLSPQGYNIKKEPFNTNPFWDNGGGGGGGGDITVDSELSITSTNPVENRVITSAVLEQEEEITGVKTSIAEHETEITALETTVNEHETEINRKQDKLTFDSTPLENSKNPVTSEGILTAIITASNTAYNDSKNYTDTKVSGALDALEITGIDPVSVIENPAHKYEIWVPTDDVPTAGETDPIQSGAVYTALTGKQDKLTAGSGITIENNVISATGGGGSVTVDSELSETSTNPVENRVITNALKEKGAKTIVLEKDVVVYNDGETASNYADSFVIPLDNVPAGVYNCIVTFEDTDLTVAVKPSYSFPLVWNGINLSYNYFCIQVGTFYNPYNMIHRSGSTIFTISLYDPSNPSINGSVGFSPNGIRFGSLYFLASTSYKNRYRNIRMKLHLTPVG